MQSIQPDSLNIRTSDSASKPIVKTKSLKVKNLSDSSYTGQKTKQVSTQIKSDTIGSLPDSTLSDSLKLTTVKPVEELKDTTPLKFRLFSSLHENDSAVISSNISLGTFNAHAYRSSAYTGAELRNSPKIIQKFWTFGIGLSLVFSFIFIRISYQKYLSGVMTSVFSMQLAEKLMRDKNMMVRRMFLFLNLNFVIALALFSYSLLQYAGIQFGTSGGFLTYMYLFLILVAFLILRFGLIQLIGALFDSTLIFKEYLHNTYLINKNLGLFLLPLAISVFYLRQPFADIAFFTAGMLIAISLVYKYFRALQILMKHKVFLFYSILYFCVLEILPVLAGIKYVLSLR